MKLVYQRDGNRYRRPETPRTEEATVEVDEVRVRTDGTVEGYRNGIGVEQIEQGDTLSIIRIVR